MIVSRVRMTNVRSRHALQVEVGRGLTILVGPNGAGKTTVVEALALVLEGTPLRAPTVRDLISKDQGHLRVEVDLEGAGTTVTAAAAYSRDGDRRLTADGAALADSSRWCEALPVRTFVPDDLRLIKGSPRRRREYLDTLAARCEPEYSGTLRRYEEALAQRNSLLRASRPGQQLGGESDQFAPWENLLAQAGLAICRWRASALASFVGPFQLTHAALTGESPDALRLIYRTNAAGLDEEGYRARLEEMREGDRQRTYTHLGPHRDDFRLLRNGLDVRDCASQGEQRTALLTLVLAEWDYQCAAGERLLLLLDDVMSELDEARRRALVAFVGRGGQVVVTTTDLRYFTAEELQGATVVELSAGDGQAGPKTGVGGPDDL
ncbi:MAG: DNA replication and repair protein RecF [Thermoleophilia bacterium]|nr:DNA replication and repair protein RecF [Thermoleophilia bacterium]